MITTSVAEGHNSPVHTSSHCQRGRSRPAWGRVLTGALLGEAAGVPEQLEGLLEARRVLRGPLRGLDAGDEGAHLPLGLAGGRGQQALVALVQGTGADRLCHRQNRDLEEEERCYNQHDESGGTTSPMEGREPRPLPPNAADLVVFVDSVEDDQSRVSGDLELGVGHRGSVVHHHHQVFGLRTHRRHVHRPADPDHTRTRIRKPKPR